MFHTIDVKSETLVLHLHAYGVATDTPGYELPIFDSPEAQTYRVRTSGGFQPPLAVVTAVDARADVADGKAAVLVMEGEAAFEGPYVFPSLAALEDSGLDRQTPILLPDKAGREVDAAKDFYRAGYPLVSLYGMKAALQALI